MSTLFPLALASLRARSGRTLLTFLALTLALTFLALMGSLARGFRDAVERNAQSSFLSGQITVMPGISNVNRNIPLAKYLALDDPRTVLDADFAEELAARPEVELVSPQVAFPYPATAHAEIDGRLFEIDLPLLALDKRLIARERNPEVEVQGGEIPVVVPHRLLDLYNFGVAPTSGDSLPRLSDQGLLGFRFEAELGYSSFLQTRPLGHTVTVPFRITGFTEQPSVNGAVVSYEQARALLQRLAPGTDLPDTYRTVLVLAKNDAAAERLAGELRGRGYRANTLTSTLAGVDATATSVSLLLGLLTAFVLVLAFFTAAMTMLAATAERTGEIGILRALGARRADIVRRFLLEAGLLGAVSGIAGGLLGIAIGAAAGQALERMLPNASFLREGVLAIDALTVLLPVVGGIVVAMLAALGPSLRAASVPPVRALREQA